MNESQQSLETLKDIKNMMERSSRFISLSGLSGIAAGTCALIGAWFAGNIIHESINWSGNSPGRKTGIVRDYELDTVQEYMGNRLFQIAIITFFAALLFSFLFTYLRSKKNNI